MAQTMNKPNAVSKWQDSNPQSKHRVNPSRTQQKTLCSDARGGVQQKPLPSNGLGEILSYLTWMETHGYRKGHSNTTTRYSEATIKSRKAALLSVARQTNILNPEQVKEYLQTATNLENSRKNKLIDDLTEFYGYKGFEFSIARFPEVERLPHVPLESDIDFLIQHIGKTKAAFVQVMKETGARPGEVWRLTWEDVDLEHATLRINNPEKGSSPREFKNRTSKLVAMLQSMRKPRRFVFHADNPSPEAYKNFEHEFFEQRKQIAKESGNDRLFRVNFRGLRHFKGTAEYLRTRDIFYVKRILGHKNIKNTEIYINIVGFDDNENYVCRVASTKEERISLIEAGFNLVEADGEEWYFRKRK